MKRLLGYIFLCTAILASCSSADKKSETTFLASDTEKIAVKPFSDSLKADTFKVKLIGTDPKDMHLAFTIISFNGVQLYKEEIKATELFNNYNATIDLHKKKNQITFLKEELNRFFDEENFMEPAITDQESPDKHVPDLVFYEELKKSQLNGFIYRLGKDLKRYIGWSETDKKVKTYYSCCK